MGNWSSYDDNNDQTADQSRVHNEANELTEINDPNTSPDPWINPVHDAAGNMTTIPQPSDWTDDFTLVYDAWNRLVQVKDATTIVEQYEYDGRGRRIVKQTDYSSGTPQDAYDFYYNTNYQVVEERLDSDPDPQSQYVWHPYYIDAIAMRWHDSNTDGANIQTHHYVHDANYNVGAVYHASCQPIEHYHYSPYGRVTILDANLVPTPNNRSQIQNPYLYTGRRLDANTGLYYYRARNYHSQLGRFINRDPLGLEGSEWNLYEYVSGTPLTKVDPSGNYSTLLTCLKSPVILSICLGQRVVTLGKVAVRYTGKKGGAKLVKRLVKWGGEVLKNRGKGSHTIVKLANGETVTVPCNPGIGTVKAILKKAMGI